MSYHPENAPLLDATIRIDHLPAEGREIDIVATPPQLEALAELMHVTSVERLEAKLAATPFRGGIRVEGRLTAAIVQPCVVTFAPVRQEIDEPVDRVFLPGPEQPRPAASNVEVFVDLDDEDLPDHIEGPEVDLSALVTETLALAIDPYPRAEGASIESLGIKQDDEDISPFASLKSLIDPDDKS